MPFGFYIIMAAQFFSSLADNALLVAALREAELDVRPSESMPSYDGANKVRYYYGQDHAIADRIIRITRNTLRGPNGGSEPVQCEIFTSAQPPLPTIFEIWLGTGQ